MAICIASVSAKGKGLLTSTARSAVAKNFLDWRANDATDIGTQTANVLTEAAWSTDKDLAAAMTAASVAASRGGSAGHGALMRTGIVGVVALRDRDRTAEAARVMAALTHAAPDCLDSCVLWSEAVRVAVMDGEFDVRAGIDLLPDDRQQLWLDRLTEAETKPPSTFAPNGWTVTPLQAAWASIHATRDLNGEEHVEAALQTAIAIGSDTDTVAAIAGALLGACYGLAGLPRGYVDAVHGLPGGIRAPELIDMALRTATAGV